MGDDIINNNINNTNNNNSDIYAPASEQLVLG
jgi:hypothetical protein